MEDRRSSRPDMAHRIGYGVAVGGAALALILGFLILPAQTVGDRWLHSFICAAVIIGVGAGLGLAMIVVGGLRSSSTRQDSDQDND